MRCPPGCGKADNVPSHFPDRAATNPAIFSIDCSVNSLRLVRTPDGNTEPLFLTAIRRRRGRLDGSGIASVAGAGTSAPTFAPPVYVDQELAGGEPEVFADTLHGTLVYSAHEGTTHLYRDGIVSSPWGDFSFVSNYCNQVNVWTSPA